MWKVKYKPPVSSRKLGIKSIGTVNVRWRIHPVYLAMPSFTYTWSIFTTSVHLLTRWSRWQLSCPYTPIHIYNYFADKLRSFAGRWCANTYIMYFFKPLEKKEQKASRVLVITSQSWKRIRFWQKFFFPPANPQSLSFRY